MPQTEPVPQVAPKDFRTARLFALVAGVLGALFALATPFLPVTQTTATLSWPQDGELGNVQAPLMSQVPIELSASIPCAAVGQLPAHGGMLLATAPPQGDRAALEALFVRVSESSVDVVDRNAVVASAGRERMADCSAITITSDNERTFAAFEGLTTADGQPVQGQLAGDLRPQVVGVFSDLSGAVPQGLAFDMTVDTRFSSTPTVIKLVAMIAAVLCTVIALVALARLDTSDGRGHRRFLPASWLKPTWADGAVVGTLVLWHFMGANTSDDGYILSMVRVAPHAGYMANYFRWYGVPEAPFGWYYYVIQLFAEISTASPWVRLPALGCAILCWMVISREVVPRLGNGLRGPRGSRRVRARFGSVPLWTGGLVFLAFWLPFDNGLRSEPIVALGALLTWVSIERAIATGRLLPAAMAVLIAAFTLAAAPTGLMCVAALLAGIRPLTRIVVRRHREHGTAALLAPIAAAGFLVLVVVFGDQTFAGIMEANRVRQLTGPNLAWYQDYLRYYYLFVETVDGSLARRFAFLVMLLCLFTTMLVLLRRRRVPGIASAPTWRLMGVVFGTLFFMMFNPTKWTHHFGVYAGIAGSLAAVTAVAVSATALRARKNRMIFLAGLLFVLAVSFSGINGYWYVSSYGVPWFDKRVSLSGYQSNTAILVLFGVALALVAWHSLREGYAKPPSPPGTVRGRRIRKFAAIPLTVVAAAMVLFEVASLAKGAVSQYPAYSLARSNVDALTGSTCGLANDVLVETDPNAGRLNPIIDPAHPPANPNDPLAGGAPVGFDPNGVPDDLSADAVEVKPGTGNTSTQSVGAAFAEGQNAGTGGGQGAMGVNGSTVKLPFGLDPAITPVLGSYQEGVQQPAHLVSSWYELPERSPDAPLVVITAAGRILSYDDTGAMQYGQSLTVDYGKREADGSVTPLGTYLPRDIGPFPSWRNLRIPLDEIAPEADAVRIVANDPILIGDQWLAFTPPRVPKLESINSFVGTEQPVLLDWAVGLQFPCQRPFDHRNGVAEVPKYRILPDRPLAVSSTNTWQAQEFGGPLGFSQMLAKSTTIPTYLKDDWARDWGTLERYDQYYEATPARLDTGTATRSGLWDPGMLRVF
ncbi:arabinosyltransferase [Nocardia donostiensis]|uniref:Arabinosyltransferase n=1 Tax=Nocardia donostiensis TaxID=1538463 RepID=A0A1W0AVJ8_9NOCA|nr:arabinosyltransferase domain-containing protein [Nocardia donostiensis]ONM46020.1 arabinosyltransferase [Nocardia donostiensis]OQS14224.1 arabinosyltransferase [Nocardia donostiensis]OQS18460.1 arabinosyltransferase [Nocardia donostiensis]